jgi:hypothetical protein
MGQSYILRKEPKRYVLEGEHDTEIVIDVLLTFIREENYKNGCLYFPIFELEVIDDGKKVINKTYAGNPFRYPEKMFDSVLTQTTGQMEFDISTTVNTYESIYDRGIFKEYRKWAKELVQKKLD